MKVKFMISTLTLFTIMLISAEVDSYKNSVPHEFNFMGGECKSCHITYEYPIRFKAKITDLCNECHEKDDAISHVVGVKPSMYLTADFPLDERGEMTCNSCHDIHMERNDSFTNERTYLLRSKLRGKEFCDDCHLGTMNVLLPDSTPSHIEYLQTAHLGYNLTHSYDIDSVSQQCLVCHDGTLGKNINLNMETGLHLSEDHPIGGNYKMSYAKSKTLRYFEDIDPEIIFFEDKVGCASCHDPYNLNLHKLILSNASSKLCFKCHDV